MHRALLVTFLLLAPHAAFAQLPVQPGYAARPCGFDLDGDGVAGEAGECDFCDATVVDGLVVAGTSDPDGDTVDEDLIYVDCDAGTDQGGCGRAGQPPCATIAHAWEQEANGAAACDGGLASDCEDIICFRGTCTTEESVDVPVSGLGPALPVAVPASGAWPVEHPDNPTMLVGWDYDGDGAYPPYDTDDVAVIDGGPDERKLAFAIAGDASFVEMAHFVARDYGGHGGVECEAGNEDARCGFLVHGITPGNATVSHRYFHDLELERINAGLMSQSNNIVFSHFRGMRTTLHFAYENLAVDEFSSYGWRGNATPKTDPAGDPAGCLSNEFAEYLRIANVTMKAHGADADVLEAGGQGGQFAAVNGYKMWGCESKIEIIDSLFDMNRAVWSPKRTVPASPTYAIRIAQCQQDVVVRNNRFIDWASGVNLQPDDVGVSCSARPILRVTIDRNVISNTYPYDASGLGLCVAGTCEAGGQTNPCTTNADCELGPTSAAVGVGGCADRLRGCSASDLVVSNNVTYGGPWRYGVETGNGYDAVDCDNDGEFLRIVNNTFALEPVVDNAMVVIGKRGHFNSEGNTEGNCMPPEVTIRNNVVMEAVGGKQFLGFDYVPPSLSVSNNVYVGSGSWDLVGASSGSLAAWQTACSCDADSRDDCTPAFVDSVAGNYHLAGVDTCARDAGAALDASAIPTSAFDLDAQERAVVDDTLRDVGADEVPVDCTTNADCDDGNACTDDSCNVDTCAYSNNTASCDDGLFCNGADTCAAGACTVHTGIDPCTGGPECANVCDDLARTCNPPRGTPCTPDGDLCTDDVCDGFGVCGLAKLCLGLDDECIVGVCDGASGECVEQSRPDATPCDDGLFCTGVDACEGGICVGPGDPCTGGPECANVCDEAADTCELPDGAPCTDDGNVCTDDECDGNGACTHSTNTLPCDDGDFCTMVDACSFGSCVGIGNPCSGGGECSDTCDPIGETCFNAAGSPCTPDVDVCTDDVCDGAGACIHPFNTAPCDDGSFCNGLDSCDGAGSCAVHAGDPCPALLACEETADECTSCIPGDCNQVAGIDAGDPVCTVLCLIGQAPLGADCGCAADCNCVGGIDAGDPICDVLRLIGDFETDACTASCAFPPPGDDDCDGLADGSDPCPFDPLNRCAGPVAICDGDGSDCLDGLPVRLNLGIFGDRTDCNGDTWYEDQGTGNTNSNTAKAAPITAAFGCLADAATREIVGSDLNATDLLRSYAVPNGSYVVNMLFAELNAGTCTIGSRTIDVTIEGVQVLGTGAAADGFDQYAVSLAQNGMDDACGGLVVRSFVVDVTDGSLDLVLTEDDPLFLDKNANFKAIEVLGILP